MKELKFSELFLYIAHDKLQAQMTNNYNLKYTCPWPPITQSSQYCFVLPVRLARNVSILARISYHSLHSVNRNYLAHNIYCLSVFSSDVIFHFSKSIMFNYFPKIQNCCQNPILIFTTSSQLHFGLMKL